MVDETRLKELIVSIGKQAIIPDSITDETQFTFDLGFESIQMIELIIAIEKSFNVEIDDDEFDLNDLIRYGKLRKLIDKKLEISVVL